MKNIKITIQVEITRRLCNKIVQDNFTEDDKKIINSFYTYKSKHNKKISNNNKITIKNTNNTTNTNEMKTEVKDEIKPKIIIKIKK